MAFVTMTSVYYVHVFHTLPYTQDLSVLQQYEAISLKKILVEKAGLAINFVTSLELIVSCALGCNGDIEMILSL